MAAAPPRKQELIDEATMRIERTDVKGSGFIQFPPQRPFSERLEKQPPTLSHQANPQLYQHGSGYNAPAQRHNGTSAGRGDARPQHAAYPSGPSSHQQRAPAQQQYRPVQQPTQQHQYRPVQQPPAQTYTQAPANQSAPTQQHSNGHDPCRAHQSGHSYENGSSARGRGYGGSGRTPDPDRGRAPPGRGGYSGRGRGAPPPSAASGRGGITPAGSGVAGRGPQAARPPPVASQPRPTAPAQAARTPAAVAQVNAAPSETDSDHAKLSKSQLKRLMKKKREGKL